MKFQWINEGQIKKEGSRIEIWAPAQSDFFCNKVGLLAQAPVGNGGIRVYEDLKIESRTVKNIRFGS